MKTIEQFKPYQQAKLDMQAIWRGRQLAHALMQLLRIQPSMALAAFLGQDLGLSNQAAMETWVMEQLKNEDGAIADDLFIYLVNAFERRVREVEMWK